VNVCAAVFRVLSRRSATAGETMNIAVYDTYVTKKDGRTMHFDIIVPEQELPERVFGFGCEYLKSVGQEGQPLAARECQFCHVERASAKIEQAIRRRGYFIQEMEGCR
jgi:hypothetical protein